MWFNPQEYNKISTRPIANLANIANLHIKADSVSQKSQNSQQVNSPEKSTKSELQVIVLTPAGNPMAVQARDTEHMDFLTRMNPSPMLVQPIDDT